MTLTADPAELVAVSAERRRRRRPVLALLVLVSLLVGVVATGVALLRHAPLENGSGVLAFGREAADGTDAVLADATLDNAFGTDFRVVDPEGGTPLVFAFGLHNAGRFDVEILDVGLPFPEHYFARTGAFASDAPGGVGLPLTPLKPFVLESGGHRDVGVRFTARGCPDGPDEAGTGTISARHVPVTWRFLGVTRVSQVPLHFAGSVSGLPQCGG